MTSEAPAELDHVVINALRDLDAAAEIFMALGFSLTPPGRHSLGSVNRLTMAPTAYLELVGVPAEGRQRQEILDSPPGLSGLVFKTADADATHARLGEAGLEPAAPTAFSRPVEIGGEAREARFRTVRVPQSLFPAGRVYFCEHLTPELVWREEWLVHPNGFCGIDRIEVASEAPDVDAARYAAAAGGSVGTSAAGPSVDLGDFRIDVTRAEAPRFTRLGLRFRGLDALEAAAGSAEGALWSRREADRALVEIPSLELSVECRSVP